jgi:hypothetical protein
MDRDGEQKHWQEKTHSWSIQKKIAAALPAGKKIAMGKGSNGITRCQLNGDWLGEKS